MGARAPRHASNRPLLERLLAAKEFRARAAAVRVLQHWFDRVDGAMALLARMVSDDGAARPARGGARAQLRADGRRRRRSRWRSLAQPMDYYLQYVARLDDDDAGAGVEAGC